MNPTFGKKESEEQSELEQILGIRFHNKDVLLQAATHQSFLKKNPAWVLGHNELLALLGRKVLEMIVAEYLIKMNSKKSAYDIASLGTELTSRWFLGRSFENLGLDQFILADSAELEESSNIRDLIISDALKALVGAIYLDHGLLVAREFVLRKLVGTQLAKYVSDKVQASVGSRSALQERAQADLGIVPYYRILKEEVLKIDNEAGIKEVRVVAGVYFNKELVAQGEGRNRTEAKEKAAEEALKVRGWFMLPFHSPTQ